MNIPPVVWIAGGAAVLLVIVVYLILVLQRRRVDFTPSDGQEPEWMKTAPRESVARIEESDQASLYGQEAGERVASAFAEQIEDIVHARLKEDPALAGLNVDFGTGADGGLEIWVDGERYTAVDRVPNARLRDVIQQAIERWNQR